MRILFLMTLLLVVTSTTAKDTLNVKSSKNKWQIELIGSYNYNYRSTGIVRDVYDLIGSKVEQKDINQYLDTGNIACYTKIAGVLLTRKIWKPINIQLGVLYGRKGYMYARQLRYYNDGLNKGVYINIIPERTITIPVKINAIFTLYKKIIRIGASLGCDVNFYPNRFKYEDIEFSYTKSNLSEETSGIFGFTPVKKFPDNTRLLHEYYTVPRFQYNVGLIIQIKIYKNLFSSINYNYISQFKYVQSGEYYYNSFPSSPGGGFSYEVKPYIHSFGVGLGFEF
jgi:hypothetical protein